MLGVVAQENAAMSPIVDFLCLDKAEVEENIRYAGEDVKAGEGIFKKGITLSPAHIGMLAVVGRSQIAVSQRPTVSILSTGDEILELDETPEGPQPGA